MSITALLLFGKNKVAWALLESRMGAIMLLTGTRKWCDWWSYGGPATCNLQFTTQDQFWPACAHISLLRHTEITPKTSYFFRCHEKSHLVNLQPRPLIVSPAIRILHHHRQQSHHNTIRTVNKKINIAITMRQFNVIIRPLCFSNELIFTLRRA